ncbi:hypothetical protein [Microbulbifer guangxiensis]|uniref:hypothetical protein n=1 Tax=Microbulbifer guangxiensis TaxID=2904249 RepID=UPI001F30BE31|nr:hypothetical protein [Microbulbifer guangxiensis]
MRFSSLAAIVGLVALAFTSGCGYLPSEDSVRTAGKSTAHARINVKPQTVTCGTPARGFRKLGFKEVFTFDRNADPAFAESSRLPAQFDVYAYVWGHQDCRATDSCDKGDYYWLIERGPGNDFSTWVVTPQYPHFTIQSSCRGQLKVGERYRFSFSRGKLVGFSR